MKLFGGLLFCSVLLPASVVQAGTLKGRIRGTQEQEERVLQTGKGGKYFQRIASFPVCLNVEGTTNCNTDTETSSEIAAATEDGNTVIYTDSLRKVVGFIDISDPSNPIPRGTMDPGGDPKSVVVKGLYALVAVNTSPDSANPSGFLLVVRISDKSIIRSINLTGQPDCISLSPDKTFAAVAIENARSDEDEELPAGFVMVVDISKPDPAAWATTPVDLTASLLTAGVFEPNDPEPEYISINKDNVAAVTLQENNAVAIVDLEKKSVIRSFSSGTANLVNIDILDDRQIKQDSTQLAVPRESDGVAWIDTMYFATADEGDLNGGSRGFTIYNKFGKIMYTSGNLLDVIAVRLGHYPDGRSDNKGNEPETIAFGKFGKDNLLFVNSERSSVVFVFNVNDVKKPVHVQTLPSGVAPEGVIAIPSRGLLITSSEGDDRADNIRSVVTIYRYGFKKRNYPTLVSANRKVAKGVKDPKLPIPWGAMSGLAADLKSKSTLYAIEDSAFKKNRIFVIDTSSFPAVIRNEIFIRDTNRVITSSLSPSGTGGAEFSQSEINALVNQEDLTVNLDLEGIAVSAKGGFWIATEGAGGVTGTPTVSSLNFLLKVTASGVISKIYTLPAAVNALQLRFGFEGVAEDGNKVVITFQRAWLTESNPRIGIFDSVTEQWDFVFYPLDAPASQFGGGWVGLSDISPLGDMKFLVVERDNRIGLDAAIKKLYKIDLKAYVKDSTITKVLVRDLLPDLRAPKGVVYEKIEGLAVTKDGDVWIINDNDGLNNNNGETQLLNLGELDL
jgi:hypothetical protein